LDETIPFHSCLNFECVCHLLQHSPRESYSDSGQGNVGHHAFRPCG